MAPKHRWFCCVCAVPVTSILELYNHTLGQKHRQCIQQISPQQAKDVGRLQHFVDLHLKKAPVLGLEYIDEQLVDNGYYYSCQMCNAEGEGKKILAHIIDSDHIGRYINRHHSSLSVNENDYTLKPDFLHKLKGQAYIIFRKHGNKRIRSTQDDPQMSLPPIDDGIGALPPETRAIMKEHLSTEESFMQGTPKYERHSLSPPGRKTDDYHLVQDLERKEYSRLRERSPPLGCHRNERDFTESKKRFGHRESRFSNMDNNDPIPVRSYPERDQRQNNYPFNPKRRGGKFDPARQNFKPKRGMFWKAAIAEFDLIKNDDFFEYLKNFAIEDDDDATFVRQISQNCTSALLMFREEQVMASERMRITQSRRAHRIPNVSVSRTDLHLAHGSIASPVMPSNPANLFPKNSATEIFFDSIKNMEEAEVVQVLQNITSTNPAFRGIDIFSVVKYLKDSGMLKKR